MTEIQLPSILENTSPTLAALTDALGVSREILASDDEINTAWTNLPSVLKKVPPELRSASLARMCVAVSAGLFDSAINYIWNASIIELRGKVQRFGLNVVQQATGNNDFDEQKLFDLKDAELLSLSLKLNLITEDGFFFLDQCRDIRNNFSAAHPAVGNIDDYEFISFVNRCAKYALGEETNPVGVDIQAFVSALKAGSFSTDQTAEWVQRLNNTHEAQRELLFGTLHGMYSDPESAEETRVNALSIVATFVDKLTPQAKSNLIDRHQDYLAKGDEDRHAASQQFFEKLEIFGLLAESERHALISRACRRLLNIHQAFDNFYNEPPFAERLAQISDQAAVPATTQQEYVLTVATCRVGNPYGVSRVAIPHYDHMVKNFSPAEVAILLQLPGSNTVVGSRLKSNSACRASFKALLLLISSSTVPTKVKAAYESWIE